VLVATTLADLGLALLSGVVAAAAWAGLVVEVQRRRRRRALDAFVGVYGNHRKLRGELISNVHVFRDGDELRVTWPEYPNGEVTGTITLSDRFPKGGRGTYEHHLLDGRIAWGTWDVELDATGHTILVTTRYVHTDQPVEIVQGSEWRRIRDSD
jgi:hypothetical protein